MPGPGGQQLGGGETGWGGTGWSTDTGGGPSTGGGTTTNGGRVTTETITAAAPIEQIVEAPKETLAESQQKLYEATITQKETPSLSNLYYGGQLYIDGQAVVTAAPSMAGSFSEFAGQYVSGGGYGAPIQTKAGALPPPQVYYAKSIVDGKEVYTDVGTGKTYTILPEEKAIVSVVPQTIVTTQPEGQPLTQMAIATYEKEGAQTLLQTSRQLQTTIMGREEMPFSTALGYAWAELAQQQQGAIPMALTEEWKQTPYYGMAETRAKEIQAEAARGTPVSYWGEWSFMPPQATAAVQPTGAVEPTTAYPIIHPQEEGLFARAVRAKAESELGLETSIQVVPYRTPQITTRIPSLEMQPFPMSYEGEIPGGAAGLALAQWNIKEYVRVEQEAARLVPKVEQYATSESAAAFRAYAGELRAGEAAYGVQMANIAAYAGAKEYQRLHPEAYQPPKLVKDVSTWEGLQMMAEPLVGATRFVVQASPIGAGLDVFAKYAPQFAEAGKARDWGKVAELAVRGGAETTWEAWTRPVGAAGAVVGGAVAFGTGLVTKPTETLWSAVPVVGAGAMILPGGIFYGSAIVSGWMLAGGAARAQAAGRPIYEAGGYVPAKEFYGFGGTLAAGLSAGYVLQGMQATAPATTRYGIRAEVQTGEMAYQTGEVYTTQPYSASYGAIGRVVGKPPVYEAVSGAPFEAQYSLTTGKMMIYTPEAGYTYFRGAFGETGFVGRGAPLGDLGAIVVPRGAGYQLLPPIKDVYQVGMASYVTQPTGVTQTYGALGLAKTRGIGTELLTGERFVDVAGVKYTGALVSKPIAPGEYFLGVEPRGAVFEPYTTRVTMPQKLPEGIPQESLGIPYKAYAPTTLTFPTRGPITITGVPEAGFGGMAGGLPSVMPARPLTVTQLPKLAPEAEAAFGTSRYFGAEAVSGAARITAEEYILGRQLEAAGAIAGATIPRMGVIAPPREVTVQRGLTIPRQPAIELMRVQAREVTEAIPKQPQAEIAIPKMVTIPRTPPIQTFGFGEIERIAQIVTPITGDVIIQPPRIRQPELGFPPPQPPTVTVPKQPRITKGFGGGGGVFGEGVKAPMIARKQPKRYAPSLVAREMGIKAPRRAAEAIGEQTGGMIRPTIDFGFKRVRRRR